MTITPEQFLKCELEWGIGFHNDQFKALAAATVEQFKELKIRSVLDFGAGTGVYSDAAHRAGYEVKVFEIWQSHIDYILENNPALEIVPKPVTTDLMMFIEVAEHMTDADLMQLFATITPRYILFSSTSETTSWDVEWGHINVKQQDEWVAFFQSIGYRFVKSMNHPTTWAKLFEYGKS